MRNNARRFRRRTLMVMSAMMIIALIGVSFLRNQNALANHPVLLEGNCDSPVPGSTLVEEGTCGDFDGDGRIGAAEDTDGADRIFGTLAAAIGPGTGAAAGTGANGNGAILIVTSGRFAESITLSNAPGVGELNLTGNLSIAAAPGVHAVLDAVLQGDPNGGNNTRQAQSGISINMNVNAADRAVLLRNLTIRNFLEGVTVQIGSGTVHIDRCNFENNLDNGVHVMGNSTRVVITNSQFDGQGRRIGSAPVNTPSAGNGNGIRSDHNSQVRVGNTVVFNSTGTGIIATGSSTIVLFKVETYFNGTDTSGGVTIAPNANFSQ